MKQDEFESLSIFEQATITPAYQLGFQAGAASRDAEVAQWQKIIDEEAKDSALVIIERDQLRAQINVLREALSKMHDTYFKTDEDEELCERALASTPEQSITEYRNKVIEAFVNEFSRHVGGDGEFWLHELQDFAMKEQS